MALWLPKWLRSADEEGPPEDSSRRTFIFMGAAAGLALAIPAPIEIFQLPDIPKAAGGVGGFSLAEANRILKEIYLPVVTKQLENQTLLLKYMEKEEPECSYCGAALLNNQTDCPKCGGTTRRKDFLVPTEFAKDAAFFKKMVREGK